MIIQPYPQNTVINLYEGTGWDKTYQDVRWFDSYEQRDSYLESHVKQKWFKCSVVNSNTIKLEGQQMDYIGCDYMTFFNPMQTGKQHVICCWITSIDYVNINTFSVTYEIDYIGTWFAEMVFEPCLVIREHVNDDTPGLWIEDENLDVGEMQVKGTYKFGFNANVMVTVINLGKVLTMSAQDNMARCDSIFCNDLSAVPIVADFLNSIKDHPEYVPLVTMGVTEFGNTGEEAHSFKTDRECNPADLEFSAPYAATKSYTAVNNRLRCYPYKFITADNYNGQVEQYHYEDFADLTPKFTIEGTPAPKPMMFMSPNNYKNSSTGDYTQQSIVYDAFPQVGWVSDTYRLNLAQYATQPIETLGSVLPIISGSVGGAIIGAGVTAMSALKTYQQYKYDQKTLHSKQYRAGSASGAINYYRHNVGFRVTEYQLLPQIAQRIDTYLTRYGYKVNTYKIPNIFGRLSVNYVQTVDAHIRGRIPSQAKQAMEDALNRGISFWHTDPPAGRMEELYNPIVVKGGENNG